MVLYYEGYDQAIAALQTMNEQELCDVLDTLYGRDQLPEDPDIKDLREKPNGRYGRISPTTAIQSIKRLISGARS